MPLVERDGRYMANVVDVAITASGSNKLTTAVVKMATTHELEGSEWNPANYDITAWVFLEKRDGSLNTVGIDQLKAALGWDGRDPFDLEDQAKVGSVVQVQCAAETYEGKSRMKVKWIYPADGGQVQTERLSEPERQAIRTRLCPKLRANAGGTPVATIAQKPPSVPQVERKAGPAGSTPPVVPKDPRFAAQQEFNRTCGSSSPAEQLARWNAMLTTNFAGQRESDLSPEQWDWVRANAVELSELPF